MDFEAWKALLKEYGPLVGPLVALVAWQAFQIRKLIEWNSRRHDEEVARMARVQDRLLTHLIGPQPTSADSPSIKDLKKLTGKNPPEPKGKH